MMTLLGTAPANDGTTFDAALQAYKVMLGERYQNVGSEDGRVYVRIFWACSASRYVLCFVHRATGAIHRADSWKKAGTMTQANIFRM